ncbi:MAG: FAD-binding domain-containing protein, partial [Nitrosopumilaceae archaeon]|nr:FAD-binding domain-containing protein [Nitrosopumilaceae archaeon]
PWFRIFNPWLQQEKYDKDCLYIKKWIPELEEFSPKEIHKWHSTKKESKYPKPIVTHSEEAFHTKEMFQKASSAN